MRPTAEQALRSSHPWLLGGCGACHVHPAPSAITSARGQSRCEANTVPLLYPSMNDTSAAPKPQIPEQEEEAVGPVTPTSFRERGGKKVAVVKEVLAAAI